MHCVHAKCISLKAVVFALSIKGTFFSNLSNLRFKICRDDLNKGLVPNFQFCKGFLSIR